tara:strand:- start:399 stop:620 length:222 start_codon:yes stop_codon:yes gene_type:complete
MSKTILKKIFFIILFVLIQNIAHAYIGPGMGGGIIVATIGIVIAIFAALFGLIWFPVKRFLNKNKRKKRITEK